MFMHESKVAVVIPSYKVAAYIKDVIITLPDIVRFIIVIDDNCPEGSGKLAESLGIQNLIVIYNRQNKGVGGAVIAGYKKALELGCDIVIKIDGDGQMDPKYFDVLIEPLIGNQAEYAKGNRFRDLSSLKSMPKVRLVGNSALSFFIKVASGYWDIADPTNGYTAIHRRMLEKLNLEKLSKGFFFESDMLIHLNILNAVVKDIDIPARYKNEKSSLNIPKALFQFPFKLAKGFLKRVFYKYFLYDFNMASVYILVGIPLFIVSVLFGIKEWVESMVTGIPRTAGTIMLIALPIIVSFQMILQAIQIDIGSVPKKK